MEDLEKIYKEIQQYLGKKVYRICPKCNDNHNGNCNNCAWAGCQRPCTTYGLWEDGQYPKEQCQILEATLTWNWMPDFMKHLGNKTFFTLEEAEKRLSKQ